MSLILVVDDEPGVRSFLSGALEAAGHEVHVAGDGAEAQAKAAARSYDLVLTDLRMPKVDGLNLLRILKRDQPEVEVIVLTAWGQVETAVEAMRLGAFDYLQKPVGSPAELRLVVDRALERRRLSDAHAVARSPDQGSLTFGAPAMEPVVRALRKVARTDATVLLRGETGTGKEVVARTLHAWSARAEGPFVAVNCAALTEALLESALFGHERGAFTGAVNRQRGKLELAAGGTFFLDEVGEMPLSIQAKLLRVLQERHFERLGGEQMLKADVRWVAATHRNLEEMVQRGAFREDLYHRLAVFPVRLPPLRERREDVLPLAEMLLERIGPEVRGLRLRLSAEARELLVQHPWTGNVRELSNTLERAAILAEGWIIEAEDLGFEPTGEGASAAGGAPTMEEAERQAIVRALEVSGGRRRQAAEHLGIGLRTLYEKLKRYGIR